MTDTSDSKQSEQGNLSVTHYASLTLCHPPSLQVLL